VEGSSTPEAEAEAESESNRETTMGTYMIMNARSMTSAGIKIPFPENCPVPCNLEHPI